MSSENSLKTKIMTCSREVPVQLMTYNMLNNKESTPEVLYKAMETKLKK